MSISIAIADDHSLFLDGLETLLKKYPAINLVGKATNGKDLLVLVEKTNPKVALVDISMPIMDGLEATKILQEKFPQTRVIALSTYTEYHMVMDMSDTGAWGYLEKNSDTADIIKAIECVSAGGKYYSKLITDILTKNLGNKRRLALSELEDLFTKREREIIKLLCQGKSSQQIADILYMGKRNVERCREIIYVKAGVKNLIGLVIFALKNNLFNPDES